MATNSAGPDEHRLFAGAAPYYARFRPPYPDALIADLVTHFNLDGTGRLLDLGCGPGTLTLPLARHFREVVALDPDQDMIRVGQTQPGGDGVRWLVIRAEDITPDLGKFNVVSCGSSFHWMNRDLVLTKIEQLLLPGGGIALVGGGGAWWDGPEDWHQVVTRIVQRYLGDIRRAGRAGFAAIVNTERFEETLPRNRWKVTFDRGYEGKYTWDIDSIIGFLWSTSFAGRVHFGDRVDEFEHELREALLDLHPDGRFTETLEAGLVCGTPPKR